MDILEHRCIKPGDFAVVHAGAIIAPAYTAAVLVLVRACGAFGHVTGTVALIAVEFRAIQVDRPATPGVIPITLIAVAITEKRIAGNKVIEIPKQTTC